METKKLSAGFFFLSLGVLITLITSVVSFLNLVFETLTKRFPDVLNANYQYGYSTYQYDGLRMALATLVIFFPVFLAVSYFWKKFIETRMGLIDEIIRKWVVYVILFLSSLVAIIDFVTLVKYFISGEITSRLIFKAVSVLIVVLLVGSYYIISLREKSAKKTKISLGLGILSLLLVVGAITYSFMIMGSPMKQRMLRLDDRRVGDLQNIQYQVINYWQQKEKLPQDLKELVNPISGFSLPVDPEFEKGINYEYNVKIKNKLTFELCATFSLPMPKGWQEYSNNGGIINPISATDYKSEVSSIAYPVLGGANESWDHESGRTCFERTIDKDIYPPYKK